ncbi:MAG: hypothetical protein K8T20_13575 [Planctomycetes bacterium]|nr:hypothetical protein [Planctomycetota bacterium]
MQKTHEQDQTFAQAGSASFASFAGVALVASLFLLLSAAWTQQSNLEAMTLPVSSTATPVFAPEEGREIVSIVHRSNAWVVVLHGHAYDLSNRTAEDKFRGFVKRLADEDGRIQVSGDRVSSRIFTIRADAHAPSGIVSAVRKVLAECGVCNIELSVALSKVHPSEGR